MAGRAEELVQTGSNKLDLKSGHESHGQVVMDVGSISVLYH
jgi:hypothetical protein